MTPTLRRTPPSPISKKHELRVAQVCGMDAETRHAMAALETLAGSGRVAVAGRFMPDPGVSARLAALGVAEQVAEEDFFKFRHIVIPYCGVSPRARKVWQEAGVKVTDLSAPQVRRAQVALGLLRMEGAQPLVIGRHDDPESMALAGVVHGTKIIEDTTDSARLAYAPAYGVVCQTTLSPRRVSWLVQQLRMRYRDARITFLDTTAPAMAAREQALEGLLDWCDAVVVVGQAGEASCTALLETALRKGKPAACAASPGGVDLSALAGARRIALSAGAFALDGSVSAMAELLGDGTRPQA
jgi:4-hydroxy-3-methylbut-2-enyl diphosphate reductase IspH